LAKHVLTNASLSVNSVDLSDHVKTISYSDGINGVDAAAMGELQDYEMPGTIKVSDISVTFFQDYASAKVYATIHPLVAARTTFNIIIKPDTGSAAATNPQFTIAVFVRGFQFVNGTRGDGHMSQVTFAPAGLASISAP
jgi:hypothetical protein